MNQDWDDWNEEGHAGNDNVNPGWDNVLPGAGFLQQLPSSISIQFSDQTTSSVHLVPGDGAVLVQQGSVVLVEIEDITDAIEEDFPQNAIEHVVQEHMEDDQLALVPYKYSVWHSIWSQVGSTVMRVVGTSVGNPKRKV
jgi:hypothetical protein